VLERTLLQSPQPLRPRFELVHHFSVGRMVDAGLGVTLLPRSAVPSLASNSIVTIAMKSPRISRDLGVITRREYQFSPSAQAFVTMLKMFFAPGGERPRELSQAPSLLSHQLSDVTAS